MLLNMEINVHNNLLHNVIVLGRTRIIVQLQVYTYTIIVVLFKSADLKAQL